MSKSFTSANGEGPSDERPALVLDTNTVLALWMFRDPTLNALREWIDAGSCRLHSREDALEELRRVLAYQQFGLDEATQKAIHANYNSLLCPLSPRLDNTSTEVSASLPRCRDSDDQKFMEIAIEGQATHLLTRDKALLKLARHHAIRDRFAILNPSAWAFERPLLTRHGTPERQELERRGECRKFLHSTFISAQPQKISS